MNVETVLAEYINPASVSDLSSAAPTIDAHLARVLEAAEDRDFVDVALAATLANVLHQLLENSGQYTARERSLLAAAITYFVDNDDENSDLTSPTGFEDDAEILNAVCIYLGRSELVTAIE